MKSKEDWRFQCGSKEKANDFRKNPSDDDLKIAILLTILDELREIKKVIKSKPWQKK